MTLPDGVIFSAIAAISVTTGMWAWRREPPHGALRLAVALVTGGVAGLTMFSFATRWLRQPHNGWNGARLAQSVSVWMGYPLYPPVEEGPIFSSHAGPAGVLPYSVLGALPITPTSGVLLGSACNVAVFALLAAWLLRRAGADVVTGLLGALVAAQLVLALGSLRYSVLSIHTDTTALTLWTLGAGIVLLGAEGERPWSRCAVAAACFVFATWAKQTLVLAGPAMVVAVGWRAGWASAWRLVTVSVAMAAIVTAGFVAWFGFGPMWDELVGLPSQQPWRSAAFAGTGGSITPDYSVGMAERLPALGGVLVRAATDNALVLWIVAGLGVAHAIFRPAGGGRCWRSAWGSFLVAGCGLIFTGLIGRVKVGGDVNHDSYMVFFIVVAAIVWLAAGPLPRIGRVWLGGVLVVTLAVVNFFGGPRYRGWADAWDNKGEAEYRYCLAHPGKLYVAESPLPVLLAEHRLDHMDFGLFARMLAGRPVSMEHFSRYLPTPRPLVADGSYVLAKFLTDYVDYPAPPELKGIRISGPPEGLATGR